MAGKSLLFIVAFSVAFAGCAKGSAKETEPPQGTNVIQGSGEALPDAGFIEGIVVDDSVTPLPGAVVGLEGIEGIATTDEAGQFSFTNLAPGDYVIHAARLGFGSVSQRVTVVANTPTSVTLTLAPIAVVEAYVDLQQFGLHMACGEGLVVVTVTGGCPSAVFGTNNVTADHEVMGDVQSIIGEMMWQPNSGFSSREMRLMFGINETRGASGSTPSFDEEYDDQTGPSPVVVQKDAPFKGLQALPEDQSFIRYRTWVPGSTAEPPIIILVVDQRFDLYSTVFYGEPAPSEYSAIPDA